MVPSVIRSTCGGRIRRPSPALVIALAALFLALTGTGLASNSTSSPVTGVNVNNDAKSFSIPPGGEAVKLGCPNPSQHKWFTISGGYSTSTLAPLVYSAPINKFADWEFGFANHESSNIEVNVSVECMSLIR